MPVLRTENEALAADNNMEKGSDVRVLKVWIGQNPVSYRGSRSCILCLQVVIFGALGIFSTQTKFF